MPVLDDLRYSLAPLLLPENDPNGDFDVWVQALAAPAAQVELYALDYVNDDGIEVPGYGRALSIDDCPTEALPWLAQFVGEKLPAGGSDAVWRQQIRDQPNRKRGTPAGITAAVRLTLSNPDGSIGNPTGTVFFIERSSTACPSEPAYGLTVGTLTSQTPDPDATEAAIRSNLPGGIILEYLTTDDPVWDEGTLAWSAVAGTVTWNAVAFADVT